MNHGNTESAVRKTQLMRGKGITYDTGFFNAGVSTHEPFDPEIVKREMRIFHDDLHCNGYRNPALLAKMASKVDVLSHKRLIELEEAGVQEIILRFSDVLNLDMLRFFAKEFIA